jgi:hypothetical protein
VQLLCSCRRAAGLLCLHLFCPDQQNGQQIYSAAVLNNASLLPWIEKRKIAKLY